MKHPWQERSCKITYPQEENDCEARLALSALSAVGKARSDGIYWASAVEILHNTTLIHDDIQDGDLCRRGKPTSWVLHGIPQAINAGDLGLMLPFLMINGLEISNEKRCILTQWLAQVQLQPYKVNLKRWNYFQTIIFPEEVTSSA